MFFFKKNVSGISPNVFIIKKKDYSLAVTRNKLKRRMKNALGELGFSSGVVVFFKPGLEKLSYSELKRGAEEGLKKAFTKT